MSVHESIDVCCWFRDGRDDGWGCGGENGHVDDAVKSVRGRDGCVRGIPYGGGVIVAFPNVQLLAHYFFCYT